MQFKVVQGRWCFGDAANLPLAIDLFFNSRRVHEAQQARSRISKEHNYKFNFRNR